MDWLAILAAGVLAAIGPFTAAYAVSASGLNLQFGYAGLLNFGHVAFMLVGAYGLAVTVDFGGSFWLGLVVGTTAGVLLGLIMGLPTLRLRADYFAITSIAFGEVIRLLVRSSWAEGITGGVFGIQGFANSFFDLNPFDVGTLYGFGRFVVTGRTLFMIVVSWSVVALTTFFIARLINSPWGRVIKAIREDEDATASLGKNTFVYKLQALMIGGGIAAISGMLLAIEQQNVTPASYAPRVTFIIYVIVILGGAGTILGPVLGAVVFNFLFFSIDSFMVQLQVNVGFVGDILTPADAGLIKLFLVGVAMMLLMIFRPQGILGSREEELVSDR
jgi:branched-chain amino acid transport system permease protein